MLPGQDFIHSLGWTLLHFVWQGALVWILFSSSMWLLRAAQPQSRYLFSVAWLLVLALCPLLTLIGILSSDSAPGGALQGLLAAAAGTPRSAALYPLLNSGSSLLLLGAVALWAAGVALRGVRLLHDWRRVSLLIKRDWRPLSERWQTAGRQLGHSLGISRAVRFVESLTVQVPTAVGWLRPIVLLPTSTIVGLTPLQLELIIAHELAHIRRHDYLVNWLQVLVETLLFYHPAVRAVSGRIRIERELCCDQIVVQLSGRRVEYAHALAALETQRAVVDSLRTECPELAATGGKMVERIEFLTLERAPGPRLGIVPAVALFVFGLGAMSMVAPSSGAGVWPLRSVDFGGWFVQPVAVRHTDDIPVALPPEVVREAFVSPPAVATQARGDVARLEAPTAAVAMPSRLAAQVERVRSEKIVPVALQTAPASAARDEATARAPRQLPKPPVAAPPVRVAKVAMRAGSPVDPSGSANLKARKSQAISAVADAAIEADAKALIMAPIEMPALPAAPTLVPAGNIATARPLQAPASSAAAAPPFIVVAEAAGSDPLTDPAQSMFVETREEGGRLIKRIEPRYPKLARKRGHVDTVTVELHVNDEGEVHDVRVLSPNSRPSFERSVVRAVQLWRYEPLLRNGVAVPWQVTETFEFAIGQARRISRGAGCQRRDPCFGKVIL